MSEQEKKAMLSKEMFRCRGVLEKIAHDKVGLAQELLAAADRISKDKYGYEKLAFIVEEQDFTKMVKLCGEVEKSGEDNLVFTDRELDVAREVYTLYKQACELVEQETEISEFVKKAADILFQKEAILSSLGRGIGQALGASARIGTNTVVKPVASIGKDITGKVFKEEGWLGKGQRGKQGVIGLAGSAVAGTSMSHETDVWKSLHE